MDIAAVLALVTKGLGIIETLIAVGKDAGPAIKAVTELVSGAQDGTVTDQTLAQTEANLDALISDFNQPIT